MTTTLEHRHRRDRHPAPHPALKRTPARRTSVLLSPTRGCGSRCCSAADVLAGRRVRGRARGAARHRVLVGRQLHRPDRPPSGRWTTSSPCSPGRSTRRSPSGPWRRPAGHGHRRRCSRCRSPSTWRRSRAARSHASWSSRCSRRCGRAYLVKAYAWRSVLSQDGILEWVLAPFGLHTPGYGPPPRSSRCRTSGCRT